MEQKEALIILAGVALLGIGAQWLSWWLKLPAILFLLLIGIVLGPVTGYFDPDSLFGDLLFPLVSLGVAVILFEGSLTLRFHEIKGFGGPIRNLVTIGVLVTWIVIGATTKFLLAVDWQVALLFGALVTVTGPTVIVPMLRTVRPTAKLAHILRWEGIIVDPLGALLAIVVFNFIVTDINTVVVVAKTCLVGTLFGAAGALFLGTILRRHLMPEYLHNVASLCIVLGVFTASDTLSHESGLIAVTLMGILMANMKNVPVDDILDFKESLTIMLVSGLFIVLAARLDLAALKALGLGTVWVLLIVLFVARPLAVWCSTHGSGLSWREKALLSWIAPRGIVAAAVSSLFALRLQDAGKDGAALLVPLTFSVILATVIIQSASARGVAAWLRVREPDPLGVLIVGGNPVARAIAKALAGQGFRALLADNSWTNVRLARMEGVDTYFGNPVSEHADRHLDLVGIGRMFAMSMRPALNALAAVRFKPEFGGNAVFVLETGEVDGDGLQTRAKATPSTAQHLFGESVTLATLQERLDDGGVIRATPLSEEFTFGDYLERYGASAIPLFSVDEKQKLQVFTAEKKFEPSPGSSVIACLSTAAIGKASKQEAAKA